MDFKCLNARLHLPTNKLSRHIEAKKDSSIGYPFAFIVIVTRTVNKVV